MRQLHISLPTPTAARTFLSSRASLYMRHGLLLTSAAPLYKTFTPRVPPRRQRFLRVRSPRVPTRLPKRPQLRKTSFYSRQPTKRSLDTSPLSNLSNTHNLINLYRRPSHRLS